MVFGGSTVATVVVRSGVLARGHRVAEYYTSQPAPTQWIAVGLVSTLKMPGQRSRRLAQMLVGTGQTEAAAVRVLWERLGRMGHGSISEETFNRGS
jgi:hypothetical protein